MSYDMEFITAFVDEASDLLSKWENVCLDLAKEATQKKFEELFRLAHNLKGGSRSVGLLKFGDFIHHVEDQIALLRDGKMEFTDETVTCLLQVHQLLAGWCVSLRNDPDALVETGAILMRLQGQLQAKSTSREALSSVEVKSPTEPVEVRETKEHPENDPLELGSNRKLGARRSVLKKNASVQSETIRISAQKLDYLIQTIGELSVHQSIIWHTKNETSVGNKHFLNSLQLSQKLTKDLYSRALSLRMQNLQSVFQRLERTVIDVAKELEKKIDVEVSGSDVELDKIVLEKILDPLTHLVRNAVDHGIEKSDEREVSGKPSNGKIKIEAHQDTFGVQIRISDDGKGLNEERIIKKAMEKGLLKELRTIGQDEIFSLIFSPGFSTAEKITDVSGRGVGLDVVRNTLQELQGSIRIESTWGKGTAFIINLPTSVSIIEGMTILVGGQKYVVPIGEVDEIIDSEVLLEAARENMLNLRGQVLPVHSLLTVLRHRPLTEKKDSEKSILICRIGSQKMGFKIDGVVGQQPVVVRELHSNIANGFGVLGGTILGNGEPGIILDLPMIVRTCLSQTSQEASA